MKNIRYDFDEIEKSNSDFQHSNLLNEHQILQNINITQEYDNRIQKLENKQELSEIVLEDQMESLQ